MVLDGHPRAEDAALIVTELGTNAVMHTASGGSGGSFGVALTVSEPAVTVAVTDSGSCVTTPEVQCPASDSTHGRGLAMVTALADSVMVQGGAEGRTVTAELLTQVRPGSPTPCSARPGGRRP
ncbi:ATP-binding protein [Streptomyces sp. NPDC007070]|uniref:ATP-binding protein n=1 Tax=Streptomyces sp. NPDC007070 TaxID=3154312 RepID=UPI0033C94649